MLYCFSRIPCGTELWFTYHNEWKTWWETWAEESRNVWAVQFWSSGGIISGHILRHACTSRPGKWKPPSLFKGCTGLETTENGYLCFRSEILGCVLGYLTCSDMLKEFMYPLGIKRYLWLLHLIMEYIKKKKSTKNVLFLVPLHEMYDWQL